jgi:CO/xanthine dehydrogenase Mo-binding subunit
VLPHVIDVQEAMKDDAPILHPHMRTDGVTPAPTKASNIAKRLEFNKGDAAAGFGKAGPRADKTDRTRQPLCDH